MISSSILRASAFSLFLSTPLACDADTDGADDEDRSGMTQTGGNQGSGGTPAAGGSDTSGSGGSPLDMSPPAFWEEVAEVLADDGVSILSRGGLGISRARTAGEYDSSTVTDLYYVHPESPELLPVVDGLYSGWVVAEDEGYIYFGQRNEGDDSSSLMRILKPPAPGNSGIGGAMNDPSLIEGVQPLFVPSFDNYSPKYVAQDDESITFNYRATGTLGAFSSGLYVFDKVTGDRLVQSERLSQIEIEEVVPTSSGVHFRGNENEMFSFSKSSGEVVKVFDVPDLCDPPVVSSEQTHWLGLCTGEIRRDLVKFDLVGNLETKSWGVTLRALESVTGFSGIAVYDREMDLSYYVVDDPSALYVTRSMDGLRFLGGHNDYVIARSMTHVYRARLSDLTVM